jgi:LacI family transcriptional regulator
MKDIAQKANVSVATVSKVLSGKSSEISDLTKDKVKRISRELHYKPNLLASGLKQNNSKTIGFIMPEIKNPYFSTISEGIYSVAKQHNYSLLICITEGEYSEEIKALNLLQSKRVDGIILSSIDPLLLEDQVKYCECPLVYVDRTPIPKTLNENIGSVSINTVNEFRKNTTYLIKQGCKKIALISAANNNSLKRKVGYEKALFNYGIKIDYALEYLKKYDIESGYDGTLSLLKDNNDIDGIICGNDLIAIGVLKALREKNINCPQDIKVIGFDDIDWSAYTVPSLTSVKQPSFDYGKIACKMLIEKIKNNKALDNKIVKCELVERDSTSNNKSTI